LVFLPAYFRNDERAVEAHIHHGAELVHRHVHDATEVTESCGIDHDVQRSGPLEKRRDGVLVGHIDAGGGMRRAKLIRPRGGAFGVAVRDRHPASFPGQPLCDRPPDAGCAADYQCGALVARFGQHASK
jgi:hypothetical protein